MISILPFPQAYSIYLHPIVGTLYEADQSEVTQIVKMRPFSIVLQFSSLVIHGNYATDRLVSLDCILIGKS